MGFFISQNFKTSIQTAGIKNVMFPLLMIEVKFRPMQVAEDMEGK